MRKSCRLPSLAVLTALPILAQFPSSNVTGQLILARAVNVRQQSQATQITQLGGFGAETPKAAPKPSLPSFTTLATTSALPPTQGLTVTPMAGGSGFNGITHREMRLANGGNQFSIEPPSPSIAVGNGMVLEGVNNAIQVYAASGAPLLPQAISTNQLFGLPPALNRVTNVYGPYLTDMRVFYDHGIDRWFVVQRSLDNDIFGNTINQSHLYIAVSQSSDPTGTYNIYVMDTTNASNFRCPCLSDFPQVGADQHGFYVSANEFTTASEQTVDAAILAISKASLASGASLPTTVRFLLRRSTGHEFAIQPATTPPGASYFTGNNGVEYFVSSLPSYGDTLAIWAMSNTESLATAAPALELRRITVPSLSYSAPQGATQRPGPLPYGSTLIPPGSLAYIDGADARILSAVYAGGRLYATMGTQVADANGRALSGAAYFVFSPTLRGKVLSSFSLRQGYLAVNNNHLLRPAIAVNPQGRGAVAFTLVGPDYYPSAAFVPIETFSTAAALQVAAFGVSPEDGFTGYPGGFGAGVARWGDYSGAVAASDGSIWMVAQHIPNALRTPFANWGTFLFRYGF